MSELRGPPRSARIGGHARAGRVPVPPELRRAIVRMKKMDATRKLHVSAIMLDELLAPYGEVQPYILEKVTRLLVELGELPSIEELIAKSSLGTPEVTALRAQAPREVVDQVLKKVGGGR
jgi:hypothetical protein